MQEEFTPVWSVTARYKKNHTVQAADSMAFDVAEDDRILYSKEWSQVKATNTGVQTVWPLAEAIVIDTLLQEQADAQAFANFWLNFWSVKRASYAVDAISGTDMLNLGEVVEITYDNFGFENGKLGIVIGLSEDRDEKLTRLEVLA